jgi:hypothetical protein
MTPFSPIEQIARAAIRYVHMVPRCDPDCALCIGRAEAELDELKELVGALDGDA